MGARVALGLGLAFALGCSAEDDMEKVHVLEPATGSWKNSPYWGGKIEGVMPATEGHVVSVFSAEKIPGPPRVQTVILGRDIRSPVGTNADYRARIAYGVGNANNTFDCDWGRGMQLPIVANWVQVNAVTYRPDLAIAYNPLGGRVSITGAVAQGALTPAVPATYTEPQRLVADNADVTLSTPEFAKRVVVAVGELNLGTTAVPAGLQIRAQSGATTLARYLFEEQIAIGFLLPSGVDNVRVLNNTGLLLQITVQWVLAL